MGTKEKLVERFKRLPSDFTFSELDRLLSNLGYEKSEKGKTSGSRLIYKSKTGSFIMLHRPHPGNIVKDYAMKQVYIELTDKGLI